MYEWLQEDDCAKVALFDATNTTKKRRHLLVQRSKVEKNAMLVFIESICDDPVILSQVCILILCVLTDERADRRAERTSSRKRQTEDRSRQIEADR